MGSLRVGAGVVLLGNPFAVSGAELVAAREELLALPRELVERMALVMDPSALVLALAHARALSGARFEQLLPEAILPGRVAKRLPLARSAYARVAAASARCVARLAQLAGRSASLQRVRAQTWAACFGRSLAHGLAFERLVRDHDVLVTGETGTGKEEIALALAEGLPGDERGEPAPFAELNVAAVPETLIESELFGHLKGAFTGATEARRGRVRSADRGSLFLDEIGDLPLQAQVKLLRVIETDQVQPLGSDQLHRVDVRFVGATHHDLPALVRAGRFREDLYQRLAGVVIRLPALRERPEDIAVIGEQFVASALQGLAIEIDVAAIHAWLHGAAARSHTWPGNVRELRNVLRNLLLGLPSGLTPAAAATAAAATRTNDDAGAVLPERIRNGDATLAETEAWYLQRALQRCDGNLAAAARVLGVDRSTVARKTRSTVARKARSTVARKTRSTVAR